MTYMTLNLLVLGLGFWFFVVGIVFIAQQRRKKLDPGRGLLRQYVATLAVLVVLTGIFDNVIVALGIVAYDTTHITGLFVGVVPIEDFAYSVAAVLVLPTLWGVLGYFTKDKS